MNKLIMIKDVCKILISLLIIGTLLRSCANARVLTKEEIANFMLNAYQTYTGEVTQKIIDNVNSRMGTWQSLADKTSQYEHYYSLGYNTSNKTFFFVYFTGSTTNLANNGYTAVMLTGGNSTGYIGKYAYAGSGSVTYNYTNFILTTDNLTQSTANNGSTNITNFGYNNRYWIYTDKTLKESTAWGLYAPAQRPTGQDLFAENFISSIKWELIPNSSQQITIPNKTESFYTLNKGTFTTTLASLQDSVYTDQIMMLMQAYNGTTWQTIYDKELFNIQNAFISDTFPSTTQGDIMKSQIQVKSNIIPNNVIVVLRVYPDSYLADDLGLTELEQFYYITNNKTVINSNVLDVVATFSGDTDYENEVNQAIANDQNNTNDENLQDVTDQLKKNNTFWNNLFDINSGDVNNYINIINNAVPLESGEIAEVEHIFNYLQQQSGDFIISWGSFTPHFSVKGQQIANTMLIPSGDINFSKLEREHNEFHEVMKWARLVTNISIYTIIIHQAYLLILATFGVGIELYGQNEREKQQLEAQAEKNKQKVRNQIFNANQERLRAYEKMARQKGWKK